MKGGGQISTEEDKRRKGGRRREEEKRVPIGGEERVKYQERINTGKSDRWWERRRGRGVGESTKAALVASSQLLFVFRQTGKKNRQISESVMQQTLIETTQTEEGWVKTTDMLFPFFQVLIKNKQKRCVPDFKPCFFFLSGNI